MRTEDQPAVIDFLASPSTHGGATVDRIETHASIVFLAGRRAYKLKRAVRFDYLDFSTSERRRAFCEAEVRLNKRTAPAVYRRVAAVTSEADGMLAIDGTGRPVDWLVEMNRFPQDALFDRLAAAGHLDLALMAPLANAIASFHATAARRPDHGGAAGMRWVIEGNAAGFDEFGASCIDPSVGARITNDAFRELDRRAELLEARRASGFVRQCHGDLHLRNIVLLDGRPTLFDCIEFDEAISCIDVHYDAAFLLMDLWRRGLLRHANVVWNRYLAETGDLGGVPLLPLFLSCRAAVRAKTSATAARGQIDPRRRAELEGSARDYLTLAERLLHPPHPSLVAIGGVSASGKSTLAATLAPSLGAVPGAVVLRSDEVRKRLCGVSPVEHLGPAGYRPEVSDRVYRTLAEQARVVVRAGHSAIVDAVFGRALDRRSIAQVARDASVPFCGLWLEAPEAVLVARATARRDDPSDADARVIRAQRMQDPGPLEWRRLDAALSAEQVLQAARSHLGDRSTAERMDG